MSRIKDYDDIEFKEVDRVRKVHRKKHYLLRFLIFIGIVAGVYIFLRSDYFSIKEIRVEGNTYYTDEEVIGLAKARTGSNIIFSPGIKEMKRNRITLNDNLYQEILFGGEKYLLIEGGGYFATTTNSKGRKDREADFSFLK